jgi:molybdate transport system substrate-binding protein
MKPATYFFEAVAGVGLLFAAGLAASAEIKVMSSSGFFEPYRKLIPQFERTMGHKIDTIRGPSMGGRPEAVPNRIARGEPVDVVIINTEALDRLIDDGKVMAESRTELARAGIGAVVRKGAPKPDISTVEAFKRTLLEAKSIAYSDSGSGVYLSTVVFPRLGIGEQIKNIGKMVPGSVAQAVARGEAELGFQTMSELLPVEGVDQLGEIPAETQQLQSFAAGIAVGAKEPAAGLALIKYLSSAEATPAIIQSGMTPVTTTKRK